jgi:hypothetical protein
MEWRLEHLGGAANGCILQDDRDHQVLVERPGVHRAHTARAEKDGCEARFAAGTALEVGQVEPEVRSPRSEAKRAAGPKRRQPFDCDAPGRRPPRAWQARF